MACERRQHFLRAVAISFGLALAVVAGPGSAVLAQGQLSLVPKPPVTWIPSPNWEPRPAGTRIDTIIIHDTESPGISEAATIARFFANPRSVVSAHYIIGKAGEIVQCVHDSVQANQAGISMFRGREHVNEFSIGIELVNSQSGHDPFTAAQYRSLGQLVAYLVSRYDIPLDRIVGHHDVSMHPQVKRDPASNFDWERFLTAVRTDLDAGVRQAAATSE